MKAKMYSIKEEIINAITHGFGIIASLIGLVILLIYAIMERSTISIVAFSIYGFCSLALYTSSTVYHSIQNEKWKKISRVFDHSSIFLLIAGTYTPVALLTMTGYWRIGILASVWVIAILGIGFKIITFPNFDQHKVFSLSLYILMGWIVIVALRPMLKAIPLGFFGWLLAGGLVYTFGTIFYSIKKIPYHHAIWHLFVLAGSVLHFVGIYKYLI